jgi:uncharacterized protein YodC (DUF2158 family)
MQDIKIGARVRDVLGGGPDMRVYRVRDGAIGCEWWIGHKLQTHDFAPDALELAPAKPIDKVDLARRILFMIAEARRSVGLATDEETMARALATADPLA